MEPETIVQRLEKFEEKLDRVADALFALTRVEERQANTAKTLERIWVAVERHDERLASLERKQGVSLTTQAMWSVIALLVGVIGFLMKGGLP